MFVPRLFSPEMERRGGCGEDDRRGRRQVISDVGDSTFAALLHGDVHVGGGDVAFLAALFPGSGPAVPFVLLDDVQHLRRRHEQQLLTTF